MLRIKPSEIKLYLRSKLVSKDVLEIDVLNSTVLYKDPKTNKIEAIAIGYEGYEIGIEQ